jgi:hypothetical protein
VGAGKTGETFLTVEWNRIVDGGANAALAQESAQFVALVIADTQGVLIPNMMVAGEFHRQNYIGMTKGCAESAVVIRGIFAAARGIGGKMRQFHIEKGRLQTIEPEIAADTFVKVLVLCAVIAQEARLGCQFVIAGD